MGIVVRNLSKRFGSFQAVDGVSFEVPAGQLVALLGPVGLGQEHDPADHRRAGAGRRRRRRADRRGRHEPPRPAPGRRVRLPALRPVPAHDDPPERRLRPRGPEAPARPQARSAAGSTSCSTWSSSRATPSATRRSSPAASGSAWPWPGRWRPGPRCCCWTSRSAPSTRKVRDELRTWLRRLHDEVHVTSLFVTHDQQEAFEVSDQIVVLNKGKVEQMGPPQELYERPATPFVTEFLGAVNVLRVETVLGMDQLGDEAPLPLPIPGPGRRRPAGLGLRPPARLRRHPRAQRPPRLDRPHPPAHPPGRPRPARPRPSSTARASTSSSPASAAWNWPSPAARTSSSRPRT